MWKAVLAGMTAAQIAGSSLVLAHQMPECDSGQRWRPSPEDMSAFTDARIAALKAGLKLTPEQEKNWPAFEAAIRDMSKARAERMAAREKEQPPTTRSNVCAGERRHSPRRQRVSPNSPMQRSRFTKVSTTRRSTASRSCHTRCGRITKCASAVGRNPVGPTKTVALRSADPRTG